MLGGSHDVPPGGRNELSLGVNLFCSVAIVRRTVSEKNQRAMFPLCLLNRGYIAPCSTYHDRRKSVDDNARTS